MKHIPLIPHVRGMQDVQRTGRCAFFVLTLLASASIDSAATAQTAPAPQADQVASGDIIVTAQRKEERLIETPMSITAASSDQLQKAGITNTRDLTMIVPGLNAATQGFAFQPAIRGITSVSTALGDEPNVAIYIDNVYMPMQSGNAFNIKNIERIEVLKGPQGTLFGRNATGGAIRIITADPKFDPHLSASVDYGFKLNSKEINAYGTTGLTDTVAIGLSAYYYDDAGYVDDIAPGHGQTADSTQYSVRGKLLWNAADNLKIVAEGDYSRTSDSTAFATNTIDGLNPYKNVVGVIMPPESTVDPYTVSLSFNPKAKTSSTGGYVNAQLSLGTQTLTAISSYRDFKLRSYLDLDRTNLDISRYTLYQHTRIFTQEVDLVSDFNGPINYVAGLYYYNSNADEPNATTMFAPLSPVVNGVRTITGPLANLAVRRGSVDTEAWAGFGELTWKIGEHLTAIGGYRYTTEKKEAEVQNVLTGVQFDGHTRWNNSSIRATLQYKFDDRSNVYVTYSTGFKSGAYNSSAVTNPLQVVKPETVKALEVGAKLQAGPVTILASAFHYKYDNIQLQVNNTSNPVAGSTILLNAAKAKIEGAELQLDGRLAPGLSANFGLSWLPTARYSDFLGGLTFVPAPGGLGSTAVAVDLSGTRMIRSPKLTANAGLTYETELAAGKLNGSLHYFWSDGFLWAPGVSNKQEKYGTLNGRLGWTTPDGRFNFSVWGRNLANKLYWLQIAASTAGVSGAYPQPREVGVGVGFNF